MKKRINLHKKYSWKLGLLALALAVNGVINALFFRERVQYMESYQEARQRMEATEQLYFQELKLFERKQDSLANRLASLDTLVIRQETVVRPLMEKIVLQANQRWEDLSENEKHTWTDLAINSISSE